MIPTVKHGGGPILLGILPLESVFRYKVEQMRQNVFQIVSDHMYKAARDIFSQVQCWE